MIPVQVSYFNYIDISIIVLMLIFVIFGYVRGLVKEICSLFSWAFTFVASMYLCNYVAGLFDQLIKVDVIRIAVGYVISFVVILMLLLMITSIISEKVAQSKFNNVDKAIGGVFGIAKAFVVTLFIVSISVLFAPKSTIMKGIDDSKVGPYIKDIAISACVELKAFLKSEKFKTMYEHVNFNVPAAQKTDTAVDVKKLAVPQISKVVYEKDNKDERQKMRNDYLRKQAAIGPNRDVKQKSTESDNRIDKKHK